MAFLIKSALNYTCLTTQVKHFVPVIPQLKFAFTPNMSSTSSSEPNTVTTAMNKHGVVPDVIPIAPDEEVEVSYPSGATVTMGNELTPTQVKDQPKVKWRAMENKFYTLCMTDPDAPSRLHPTLREWHHWLVVNIPGNKTNEGEVLSEYIGSGPPPDTGVHRYVFLVYKQPSKLTFDEPRLTNRSSEKRENFHIAKFAKKYELGNPVAGNFYLAEYDDYVPLLYKQLGAE